MEPGENELEVRVTTTMGNYMKTLTDNKIAQKWTNRKAGTAAAVDGPAGSVTGLPQPGIIRRAAREQAAPGNDCRKK
ncbi:MAG: hypothetical protein ACLR8Y_08835 [Alistipes indistinctus]